MKLSEDTPIGSNFLNMTLKSLQKNKQIQYKTTPKQFTNTLNSEERQQKSIQQKRKLSAK